MVANSTVKLAGHALCLGMPLLAPLGVRLGFPWLSPLIVFGAFPVLGILIGEDTSLPVVGLRRSRALLAYLHFLPWMYAAVWLTTLIWAAAYVAGTDLSIAAFAGLTLSVGIASAIAVPTAHELMHRRSRLDVLLARVMNAVCLYGHMVVEHFHHHATVGEIEAGETAPRGMSNCLTFNNTFHSDHHLRLQTPYYDLHAMHGAPRLPASYFTMFCVALVPALWRALMDKRLDALAEARRAASELPPELRTQHCS